MSDIDDIMRAIDWVGCCPDTPEEAHNIRLKAHKALSALRAENARLLEENDAWKMDGSSCADEVKRLREALKPFADKAELYSEWAGTARDAVWFPISDLRAARAAMGESDE